MATLPRATPLTRLPLAPATRTPIEPYRLFFPLGALLAWAGVLHWLLHALGLFARYHPVFHAVAQIQGFLMCFAVGFLFTAIPSRTGTPPARPWQIVVGLTAPVVTTAAAWGEHWVVAQLSWLVLVGVVVEFCLRRFRSREAKRRPPASFIWVPLALGMGVLGSLLIMVGGASGLGGFWIHDLGRLFLLQGMFLGLVIGVGAMLLPAVLHGSPPAEDGGPGGDAGERLFHVIAAGLLATTFWIENTGRVSLGLALRGVLVLAMLLGRAGLERLPAQPGLHRRLLWLSAWLIPAGYFLAAAFPLAMKAGLHVTFIGGLALMAFTVALHVTLSHGGYRRRVSESPAGIAMFGALLLLATLLRVTAEFDRPRFFVWIGAAAASFLLATVFWGAQALPRMLRRARPDEA